MEPETLYRQLGRLIETIPQFAPHGNLTSDQLQWLGRARALISEMNDSSLILEFIPAAHALHGATRLDALQRMIHALYNALAIAELKAPPSAQGAFIPAGNRFDAFKSINKVLQSATTEVLIVDPYMDETILTEFGGSIPDGLPLRLLSDQATVKSALTPAATAWAGQHSASRPLAVRLAPQRTLHDRLIIIDQTTAHSLTQSFKDFAKRSPAEIIRADDTAALKIAAYEAIWLSATVVV